MDVTKSHVGNSKYGNRIRRIFANLEISASIKGKAVDYNLMDRFDVVLEVISSGRVEYYRYIFVEYLYLRSVLYVICVCLVSV